MIARTSSAMLKKNRTACSGLPAKSLRSSGSWVAIPTEHVLRWHLRNMMQPSAISGAVENPNSSAPSRAPIATSRPVRSPPSTCTRRRPRRSFCTRTACVSDSPSSHGSPACLSELIGDAPVPPASPAMTTAPAPAFATPAATVPTPTSLTSFTLTRASWLTAFRS